MARRVFISYAREDREAVALLAKQLEAQGFAVWWDWQLVGGSNYRHAIQEELTKADKVIVVWSRHSVRSDFVIDEASAAKEAGKLVPIRIDGSAPPLGFGGLHTIAVRIYRRRSPEIAAAASAAKRRTVVRSGVVQPGRSGPHQRRGALQHDRVPRRRVRALDGRDGDPAGPRDPADAIGQGKRPIPRATWCASSSYRY